MYIMLLLLLYFFIPRWNDVMFYIEGVYLSCELNKGYSLNCPGNNHYSVSSFELVNLESTCMESQQKHIDSKSFFGPKWPLLCLTFLLHNNYHYYTLKFLTLLWLAESVRWTFEISARDVITADYTIIMSSTLAVTGYHVKFARFVLLAVHFYRSMYNKTVIRFGFCDIQNNQY